MQPGGRLRVETRCDEEDLLILFHDNGCGIPADDLDKIFEPFFTTRNKGTGLGLAISKRIIEQHHGTITVTSTPRKGTSFTIRLPRQPKDYVYE